MRTNWPGSIGTVIKSCWWTQIVVGRLSITNEEALQSDPRTRHDLQYPENVVCGKRD